MANEDGVADGPLQFDRADFGDQAAKSLTCANCASPIASAYFEARGQIICEACRSRLEAFLAVRPGLRGFIKALAAGAGAGVVGCLIYYAVLVLSGYEFGLIAILVGYMVGRAVRWGSGNRGGAAFQALAIALTYITIVSSYVPLIVTQVRAAAAKEAAQQAAVLRAYPEGITVRVERQHRHALQILFLQIVGPRLAVVFAPAAPLRRIEPVAVAGQRGHFFARERAADIQLPAFAIIRVHLPAAVPHIQTPLEDDHLAGRIG
jgi:hypothetical protein